MKTKLSVLITAFILLLSVTAEAQVGRLINRAVNKAAKTVEREIVKEVEKGAEKSVLNMMNRMRQSSGSGDTTEITTRGAAGGEGFDFASMGLSFDEISLDYDEEYPFSSNIVMEMETYDNGEIEGKVLYTMYFNDKTLNSAIVMKAPEESGDETSMAFLADQINKIVIILTDGDESKVGIISSSEVETYNAEPTDDTVNVVDGGDLEYIDHSEAGQFRKTGRSKTIAGYNCDEYIAVDEENNGEVVMWIADDIELGVNRRTLVSAGIPSWYGDGAFGGGYMMEMEAREEGEITMRIITKEINQNSRHTISLEGYQLMQFDAGR